MIALFVSIALCAAVAMGVLWMGALRSGETVSQTAKSIVAALGLALVCVSTGVYAWLGRPGDFSEQRLDADVGYLRAAKLNEARRTAELAEGSAAAQRQLALAHLDVGSYEDAVQALDRAIAIEGEHPDLLGLKVFALYYRDGRKFSEGTKRLVELVLAKNPYEVQTRMLLGQDAFMHGRYEAAVREWKLLLDAGVAPEKTRALRNAVANAEARMAHQEN